MQQLAKGIAKKNNSKKTEPNLKIETPILYLTEEFLFEFINQLEIGEKQLDYYTNWYISTYIFSLLRPPIF